jgi:4-amino-4-deoxy-L-arabinose transferase-like glycosyltransferase
MRHPGPRPALWKAISLFLFGAGLMAKATVATLPACLVIYEAYVWNRDRQQLSIGQIARLQLPHWAI